MGRKRTRERMGRFSEQSPKVRAAVTRPGTRPPTACWGADHRPQGAKARCSRAAGPRLCLRPQPPPTAGLVLPAQSFLHLAPLFATERLLREVDGGDGAAVRCFFGIFAFYVLW